METPIIPDKERLRTIITQLEELRLYKEKTRKLILNAEITKKSKSTHKVNYKYDKLDKEIQEQIAYLLLLINN